MKPTLLVASAGMATALAVAGAGFGMDQATPKLVGTVGPGFTIKLTKGGARVTSLKAGKYTFVITDRASIHNFVVEQQKGGRFEKTLTGVSFKGKKTVTLTLKRGKWKYYCAPHEATMFGFFTVK